MEISNQKLYKEIDQHLLNDAKPSAYFEKLLTTPQFQSFPFSLLSRLYNIEQSPKHHPEGNVWNHVLLVLDNAANVKEQSTDRRVFMWAALLHDIGKATTTKLRNGKITSYNHDKEGEMLARDFLEALTQDYEFIIKVSRMVRWHMQILFVTKNLPFTSIKEMKHQVDINEIALLGFCDRLGRKTKLDYNKELEVMENFIKVCANV